MTIAQIGILNRNTIFSFVSPFVAEFIPSYKIVDPALQALFPVLVNNTNKLYLTGFVRGPFAEYQTVDSYADCLTTEKSFYWDDDNQTGYVHFEHDYYYDSDNYFYETQDLYNDLDIIYIDDEESQPLLIEAPKINRQQDLVNYEKFALCQGTIQLNNIGGECDKYKDSSIYGNRVFYGYIDPEDIRLDETGTKYATRDDIQQLAYYKINDYDFEISKFTIDLIDPRENENVSICSDIFSITDYPNIDEEFLNKPIQLAFGNIREMNAIPINTGSTFANPIFKAALSMTNFGTIQVLIDNTWTTVTPIDTDEANGLFTLPGDEAADDEGTVRECRLLNAEGISITYASDLIKWLVDYYQGIDYNDYFYDTTEWEDEETYLEPIGIVFKEQLKLYDAIIKIQNGSNYGFRYDFTPDGRRTIRIDREDRGLVMIINNFDIKNRWELPIESDREQSYSYIEVKYNLSFSEDEKFDLAKNSDWLSYQDKTRQAKTLPVETFLISEDAANKRAALDALRYRAVPQIVKIILDAPTTVDRDNYMHLKIFDIIIVPLSYSDEIDIENREIESGREYYGFKAIKILSIEPDTTLNRNTITGKLLPDYVEHYIFDFTDYVDGADIYDLCDYGDDATIFDMRDYDG